MGEVIMKCSTNEITGANLVSKVGNQDKYSEGWDTTWVRREEPMLKAMTEDLTGKVFGILKVISFSGYIGHNNCAMWKCECNCGNIKNYYAANLKGNKSRAYQSCSNKSHGLSGSREYHIWEKIKDRCYNTNSKAYPKYGGCGVLMDEDFKNDFTKFLEEVGVMPDADEYWSIDRIDNSKGYVKGNMRWATFEEQQRNKVKKSNNTSGVTGVEAIKSKDKSKIIGFSAKWSEFINGKYKTRTKYYSTNKYGYDEAFKLACEYRKEQIKRLNSLGYGYAELHGL